MEELTLNDQIILYDRDATIAAYRLVDQGWTDGCTCSNCKNFAKFRDVAYGPKLRALLESLGIDPLKEREAYMCGVEVDGKIPYGGWFPFVGEWSPNVTGKDAFDFPKQDEFFFFTNAFPNATKQFGPKVLAVEFTVHVPRTPDFVPDWGRPAKI